MLYYSKRQLLGKEHKSGIITPENFHALLKGFGNTVTNDVSAGLRANETEWLKAADSKDVFDSITALKTRWNDTFYTDKNGVTYFMPLDISMYGKGADGKRRRYYVVLIDNQIELRYYKKERKQGATIKDLLDKTSAVKKQKAIQKMENTFLAGLRVLELRKENALRRKEELSKLSSKLKILYSLLGVKNPRSLLDKLLNGEGFSDDVLEPLYQSNYLAYIDWNLEYKDIGYNINQLLKKRKAASVDFAPDHSSLFGEQAAKACISQFENNDLSIVLIDIGADGFCIGLIQKEDYTALEDELKTFDFKIIPV